MLANGYRSMASRTLYYAFFHYCKALVHAQSVFTNSHKQTHIQFRKLYIKTGLVDQKYNEVLKDLIEARAQADYGYFTDLTQEELEQFLAEVRSFGDVARRSIETDSVA